MPDILYITSPTDYSIKQLASKSTARVQTDRRLCWAETFSNRPDGRIYITPSHILDTQWSTPRGAAVDQGAALLLRARQLTGPPYRPTLPKHWPEGDRR